MRVAINPESKWRSLLALDVFFVISSMIGFMASADEYDRASESTFFEEAMRESAELFLLFSILMLIIGIALVALSLFVVRPNELKKEEERKRLKEEERSAQMREIVEAVKGTIKVRCGYCGTLNDEKATTCEACGGPL